MEGAAGDRGGAGVGLIAREGEGAGAGFGESVGPAQRSGQGAGACFESGGVVEITVGEGAAVENGRAEGGAVAAQVDGAAV